MNGRSYGGLDAATADALAGRLTDPFAFLGPHDTPDGRVLRAFLPGAERVEVVEEKGAIAGALEQAAPGLFVGPAPSSSRYRLRATWPGGVHEAEDPYAFGLILDAEDLHKFTAGEHWRLAERLGANPATIDGVEGVIFAIWAPNARRVSVVGDFNSWDGRRHPMRLRYEAGVWELFVPRLPVGERYKYEIVGPDGSLQPLKADPLARRTEAPPATASIVAPAFDFDWGDDEWMAERAARQRPDAPMAIYEVHAASWLRPEGDPRATLDWDALAARLIPYVAGLGFTHVEFLPLAEHPFGGSWGYQPLGLFAPSARYGSPEGFARFVDAAHRAGIGVIVDWVPAHFPSDAHGLAHFDGTSLYEHEDPREGFHPDWNTLIYNLGRREVSGFLIASALHWLERFHVDGLRVDAVASMLYRDYSRKHGEWVPNVHGGRENLESVAFLRRLNTVVAERVPGAIVVAEESTAWPGVTAPVSEGGLGFSYKWNMGWMHDTLHYLARDPLHRAHHHHEITFGAVYAFSERFVLPISHDEVVHGKGSLVNKAPGDVWRRFANLRAYLGFMWSNPGKKLLFMGCEIGEGREWNHDGEVDWDLLSDPLHSGVQILVRDLNRLYASEPSLHASDADPAGFEWVILDDRAVSVFAFLRRSERGRPILCVMNMTPVPRDDYGVGAPVGGTWRRILDTDSPRYGGSGAGGEERRDASSDSAHGRPYSLRLTLPPLSVTLWAPDD
ncbi:MAG: 1,4-alpha-glucan branching protein GlgB [Microvirga sp.]|nr:1,4-alpha-glucan branching protein GlgB [Microvirga sp.]